MSITLHFSTYEHFTFNYEIPEQPVLVQQTTFDLIISFPNLILIHFSLVLFSSCILTLVVMKSQSTSQAISTDKEESIWG